MRRSPLVITLLAAVAFAGPALVVQLPSALDMSEADARGTALDALASGRVEWWAGRDAFLTATPAARVVLVESTLRWTKAFVMSPVFAAGWAERRAAAKPEPPQSAGSADAELAAQREEQRRGIAEMKATLPQMPVDQRTALKETIAQMEAMITAQAKDDTMQGMMREGLEAERAAAAQQHRDDLARWAREFPANPKLLIARRLREFLAACSDVAWDAKLRHDPAIDKQRFVDPAHERRSAEWKLCYRAGRAPVEAARRFTNAWLAELPR